MYVFTRSTPDRSAILVSQRTHANILRRWGKEARNGAGYGMKGQEMSSYNESVTRFHVNASAAGLSYDDAERLRRDAERVATWDMHECNGAIQWAEEGMADHRGRPLKPGRPYWVHGCDNPSAPPMGYWTPRSDTQTPAIERARALAEKTGGTLEYNADPRGWPFKIRLPDGSAIVPPVRDK